jgi:hypothetical protein
MLDPRRSSSLFLVAAAALASMASDCERSPRGLEPTPLVRVEIRLESEPAAEPSAEEQAAFERCLERMDQENHVKPSWRDYAPTTLAETAPNIFAAEFFDVPASSVHTMTVHDRNQCRREPLGNGRVTTGVSVNGTALGRVIAATSALQFTVDADGVVQSPGGG